MREIATYGNRRVVRRTNAIPELARILIASGYDRSTRVSVVRRSLSGSFYECLRGGDLGVWANRSITERDKGSLLVGKYVPHPNSLAKRGGGTGFGRKEEA